MDYTKEMKPFLDESSSEDSRNASLELPEVAYRSPSEQLGFIEKPQPSPPAKRSASYAIAFMLGAQVFSASMNVSIRLLENTASNLHPLQVRRIEI